MKKIELLGLGVLTAVLLSACATADTNANTHNTAQAVSAKSPARKIASVSQCTDISSAFEALMQSYNQCTYGASNDACNNFCSGAAALAPAPVPVPPSQPVPPPPPVDICHGPGAWQAYQQDMNIQVIGTSPVRGFGQNRDDCVNGALGSSYALNLEDSCNQQAQCVKNCTAVSNGEPQVANVVATTTTITAQVKKGSCKNRPDSICEDMCAAGLQGNALDKVRNACIQNNGVASCTATIVGNIIQQGEIGGTGKFYCQAQASVKPDAAMTCVVPVKAVNQRSYGGHDHNHHDDYRDGR